MKISRENLTATLYLAVKDRRELEQRLGYPQDSALLANWKEILKALINGEKVEVV